MRDPGRRLRLLLVGGGHSHLEVLRRFGRGSLPNVELLMISAYAEHHYSGMVPGFLAGQYREEAVRFLLEPMVSAMGGVFRQGSVASLHPADQAVVLTDGTRVPYDLVSFGVGSRPAGSQSAEVASHASVVKPMSRVVELHHRLLAAAKSESEGAGKAYHAGVVGGGAAGVEIVLAMDAFLRDEGRRRDLFLVEAGESILEGYPRGFRRLILRIFADRSIRVMTGTRVAGVEPEALLLAGGRRLEAHLTVWLTGAVGDPLFRTSGLAVDERGFMLVDDGLRSVTDQRVFGAGDCVTLENYPDTPKAGVYAVRQGPVLWESLRAAVLGGRPPRYRPQDGFLSILNTGDGKALLHYKGFIVHSRWAFSLKDWIDHRFMEKYKRLTDPVFHR